MCSTMTSWCSRWRSHFFARHELRHGFRDFEISLLAAAWIVLLVEPAFHAFILRRAALDHTQLPVGTPRVAQA
jgi:hypothetical protein